MLDFVGKGAPVVNNKVTAITAFGFGFFCAGGEFTIIGDGV